MLLAWMAGGRSRALRAGLPTPQEAYVWIWLPGATELVVAGRIARDGERLIFNYGQSYLDRPEAIPNISPCAMRLAAPGDFDLGKFRHSQRLEFRSQGEHDK